MSKIIISHIEHRGNHCLKLDFEFNAEIIKAIKNLNTTRWSQEKKCWYIPFDKKKLKEIQEILSQSHDVTYIPKGKAVFPVQRERSKTININPFEEFCSLFISYSFQDKDFVDSLNEQLRTYGLDTFLWEKDAPYGTPLKDIMYENIHKYDKVLFVASENSIKSEACHFELTQAREKNDKTWKNVLFPIHIDNFLFEVRKNMIRPFEKQNEYWKNILELKQVNSADFSQFNVNINQAEMKQMIEKLIKNLSK